MPNHLGLTDKWDVPSCGGNCFNIMKDSIELYNSSREAGLDHLIKINKIDFAIYFAEKESFKKWFFRDGKVALTIM